MHCSKCHGAEPFLDILAQHDDEEETGLAGSAPVLCASCHVCHTAVPSDTAKWPHAYGWTNSN